MRWKAAFMSFSGAQAYRRLRRVAGRRFLHQRLLRHERHPAHSAAHQPGQLHRSRTARDHPLRLRPVRIRPGASIWPTNTASRPARPCHPNWQLPVCSRANDSLQRLLAHLVPMLVSRLASPCVLCFASRDSEPAPVVSSRSHRLPYRSTAPTSPPSSLASASPEISTTPSASVPSAF